MSRKTFSFLVAMMLALPVIAGAGEDLSIIPKEAEITAADQAAVDRLGPERGAIAVISDIRTIQGLATTTGGEALATSGVALNIEQAIVDLKADVRKNEILIHLSSDVLFDFDKADIKAKAEPELTKVALIIRKKARGPVSIHGHTDARGSGEYNQKLSLRRARSVQQWLVEKGHAKADYRIEGHGETDPVAPNTYPDGRDNPDGRAKNRRVEIAIQVVE